jgi:hypothetical protein
MSESLQPPNQLRAKPRKVWNWSLVKSNERWNRFLLRNLKLVNQFLLKTLPLRKHLPLKKIQPWDPFLLMNVHLLHHFQWKTFPREEGCAEASLPSDSNSVSPADSLQVEEGSPLVEDVPLNAEPDIFERSASIADSPQVKE